MSLLIISLLLQVGFIIHVLKTGRNSLWIWVLIIPAIAVPGMIAYVAIEIIPGLLKSRTAQRTARGFKKAMDPGRELRRYETQARLGANVASRQRYAEELLRHERYDEAIAQYRQALSGLYEHDANLLLGLAQAQFGKGDAAASRATLDELIRLNPDFRSPQGHLLYARALEAEGDVTKALEEYRVVAGSFPGAEAAVRYAQLLQRQGQREEAQRVARELLQQARIAPGHYRRAQREWLEAAERLA